jgi:nitroimidazol reductase NimA-like FMN-containing flavoprotein (pyridoxamine 5'-phosphate oxidase superfamily)
VIPVGFYWTGDQAVISTATTSPKVAALSARPDVALTIDVGDTPDQARALSVRGRASVEIVEGVTEEYLAGARKLLDAAIPARAGRAEPGVTPGERAPAISPLSDGTAAGRSGRG